MLKKIIYIFIYISISGIVVMNTMVYAKQEPVDDGVTSQESQSSEKLDTSKQLAKSEDDEEDTQETQQQDVSGSILERYGLDKSQFKPNTGKSSLVEPILGKALGVIRLMGIGIGIICISIMGIKFMLGSVEEKAEYKKTFVNFTIGILIFNGVIIIVSLIYSTLNYVNLNPWA